MAEFRVSKDTKIFPDFLVENGEGSVHNGKRCITIDAFGGNKGLTSVVIPESATSIRGTAFAGCDNLKQVIFEGVAFNETLFVDGNAFAGCTSLESVQVGESIHCIEYWGNCWKMSDQYPFPNLLKHLKSGNLVQIILCNDERGSDPWR